MARKRRGRGEGLIRQRENGLWEARVSMGFDGEGKRVSKSVYGESKADVQSKLRKLQGEAAAGVVTEATTLTVGQYLDQWLTGTAKPKCSPTTFARYESLVKCHVKPHLGGVKLAKLQPLQVNNMVAAIGRAIEAEDPPRSPAWTQKMALTLLSNALRHAVRLRLVPFNPAAEIPKAKPRDKAIQFFTVEQTRTFLEANRGRRLYALLVTALGTGMRQGELLGLRWDAIDFDNARLTVRHSLAELRGGKFVLKEPKSKQSRRTIKLPAFVVSVLREHRSRMEKEGTASEFVFVTKNGTHITKSNLARQVLKPALKAAGVPRIRFHDFRHTHATSLLQGGASIKAVSQRLGHSTVELTLRVYVHLLPNADDALADQFDKIVG